MLPPKVRNLYFHKKRYKQPVLQSLRYLIHIIPKRQKNKDERLAAKKNSISLSTVCVLASIFLQQIEYKDNSVNLYMKYPTKNITLCKEI